MSSSETPLTLALQVPLSMEFSRQENWRGLLFPSPGVLPDPGIERGSPALQADSLPLSHLRSPTVPLMGPKGEQRSVLSKLRFSQWSCMDVRVGLQRKLNTEELMLLNCGAGEGS